MNKEIEFKFLVVNDEWRKFITKSTPIKQGYLTDNCDDRMIRIRIVPAGAALCIKFPTDDNYVRYEYEYNISKEDGEEIYFKTAHQIYKIRHDVLYNGFRFEVDEFQDVNDQLVIAELEVIDKDMFDDHIFNNIPWLGKDVTDDMRYVNCNLAIAPYNFWSKK